jgi:hypothetical protein
MADKSAFRPSCYCAALCQPRKAPSFIPFVFYGMSLSFSYLVYLMLLHSDCILLKINFNVFNAGWQYVMFPITGIFCVCAIK